MKISKHFNFKQLLAFALPSIAMILFMSTYSVVDGFFVSNFIGSTEFASLNLVVPIVTIIGAIGLLLGRVCSSMVTKTLGEGNIRRARGLFSLIIYFGIAVGVVIFLFGDIFIVPIVKMLGAEGSMIDFASDYLRVLLYGAPFYILQFTFQPLLITEGESKFGLILAFTTSMLNIVMNSLFTFVIDWGLKGIALSSIVAQFFGGLIPLLYFIDDNNSVLQLGFPVFDIKSLIKVVYSGILDLAASLSASIIDIVFNIQLMQRFGEDGVAAYGVFLYLHLFFVAIFSGYSTGVAPIVSYHYGAKNHKETRSVLCKSLIFTSITSVVITAICVGLAKPVCYIFLSHDTSLVPLASSAMFISGQAFLFVGLYIFISSYVTSFNNSNSFIILGIIKSLIFQLGSIILLPMYFAESGLWYTLVVPEIIGLLIAVIILLVKRKEYKF